MIYMNKQTSVRLDEDVDRFLESLTSEEATKTDMINGILRKAKENIEKGIESTTEIRIPFSEDLEAKADELGKILAQVNKAIRIYYCEEYERLTHKSGSLSGDQLTSLSQCPCIKDPNRVCLAAEKYREEYQKKGEVYCILDVHREWRQFISGYLNKPT